MLTPNVFTTDLRVMGSIFQSGSDFRLLEIA